MKRRGRERKETKKREKEEGKRTFDADVLIREANLCGREKRREDDHAAEIVDHIFALERNIPPPSLPPADTVYENPGAPLNERLSPGVHV